MDNSAAFENICSLVKNIRAQMIHDIDYYIKNSNGKPNKLYLDIKQKQVNQMQQITYLLNLLLTATEAEFTKIIQVNQNLEIQALKLQALAINYGISSVEIRTFTSKNIYEIAEILKENQKEKAFYLPIKVQIIFDIAGIKQNTFKMAYI